MYPERFNRSFCPDVGFQGEQWEGPVDSARCSIQDRQKEFRRRAEILDGGEAGKTHP